MPTIDIHRTHHASIQQVASALDRAMDALGSKFGISHRREDDRVVFSRSGVKGHVTLSADAIHVHAELGFLLAAMKPVIEREIENTFDREFGLR